MTLDDISSLIGRIDESVDENAPWRLASPDVLEFPGVSCLLSFVASDDALVLFDRSGRVREVSATARGLFETGDGLTIRDGQLHAATGDATARLNAAILSVLSTPGDGDGGGAVAVPRPSGKQDLLLTVVPLVNPPLPFKASRPAALLKIVDPESGVSQSAAERWACLFALTATEARLAEALMSGDQNLRHAADTLGVSYATARVHLRNLFDKTGTHSQAQLARLLSRVE